MSLDLLPLLLLLFVGGIGSVYLLFLLGVLVLTSSDWSRSRPVARIARPDRLRQLPHYPKPEKNMSKRDDETWGHAWAECLERFPQDDLLRKHGYAIARRPRGGEPVWRAPDGEEVPQRKALKRVSKAKLEEAKG